MHVTLTRRIVVTSSGHTVSNMTALASLPIVEFDAPLGEGRPRAVCTDCGVSRTQWASKCGTACQFIHPRYEALERQVHGRVRDDERGDERFFGPYVRIVRARMRRPLDGAQWTGITTRVGERLLETGMVEAVIATAAQPNDKWAPRPVLVTDPAAMRECRGMKMGFSPVMAMLERAVMAGYRRIALIGVPCQVHALRALERELGLEKLFVIGTPCSDNTTTDKFHTFLSLLTDRPRDVDYLEFMPDMHVEMRFRDGAVRRTPFIQLPLAKLPADFFPSACRTCFDYTNALADLTVGYMGGSGQQWLLVRNARGLELLALMNEELEISPVESRGNRQSAVTTFVKVLRQSSAGLPVRRAPQWVRPLIGWMQTTFGPKGLEFARTRVEMKAAEGILTMQRERPHRMKRGVPAFAWKLVAPYGIVPAAEQQETEREV